MEQIRVMTPEEQAIAAADVALAAAGLPTYSQLLQTVEQMATEECAA